MKVRVEVNATHTNCITGVERDVKVMLSHRNYPTDKFGVWDTIQMDGGPTGFEGFIIEDDRGRREDVIARLAVMGWVACAGTKNKWDKLSVSASEMRRAFEEFGLI